MQTRTMKLFSLILLVAGWILVVTAIALLRPGFIPVFAIAGVAVEFLGLTLLAREHLVETGERARPQEPRY
jgi:membrane-bound ClpP family serine protease